jgi:CoA-transferase family III
VFLACPQDDEWPDLCRALVGVTDLTADARFATADARRTQDDALAAVLAAAFRTRPATSGVNVPKSHPTPRSVHGESHGRRALRIGHAAWRCAHIAIVRPGLPLGAEGRHSICSAMAAGGSTT